MRVQRRYTRLESLLDLCGSRDKRLYKYQYCGSRMTDVTVLVRVKVRLPATQSMEVAEDKAKAIIEWALEEKMAIREVQIVRTETITDIAR
jgi:hypothetical protein